MRQLWQVAVAGTVVLIGLSGTAFAGPPAHVPEPASLTLLAVGMGGFAAFRYFKRR